MSDLARRLAPALPWVLLLIALVLAAIALVVFVVLRRARRRAAAGPGDGGDGDDAPAGREPLLLPFGAGRSFARAVAALKSYVPGRDARYRIPWVVMLGPSDAGTSTVARGLDLPTPFAPEGEEDPGDRDVHWHFYEQGVLLDVPGPWVLERDGAEHEEMAWRTFLRLLERFRPDRPLDAVVLTVPADLLVGADAPVRRELLSRAEALRERLWEAQRRLGLRFPVHVLVTRCDLLPGFSELCRELPEAARHEIFGWASPYPLPAAFEPQWVEQAFDALHADLFETQVEVLARCDGSTADGVFGFPGELRRVMAPLQAFLGEIFRDSVYREGAFFRGLYFTGDARAPGDAPAPVVAPLVVGDADDDGDADEDPTLALPRTGAGDGVERSPVFIRQLFAERIFAEGALARPEGGATRARGRWARAAQAATAALVLIGLPGLLLASRRLSATGSVTADGLKRAAPVARLLSQEGGGGGTGHGQVPVVALADQLASLPTDDLWSPFVPQSWGGGLEDRVADAQSAVFSHAILPAMRRRLLDRADQLLPADPAQALPIDPSPDTLTEWLRELGALSTNVARYNDLARRDAAEPADLEGLSAYLYGERVVHTPGRAAAYRRALRRTQARPLEGDRTAQAVARTGTLADTVYGRLSTTLADMESRLDGVADSAGAGTVDPARLAGSFAGGDSAWLTAAPGAPLPAGVDSALSAIPASALLQSRLRPGAQKRFAEVRTARLVGIEATDGDGGDGPPADAARSMVALRDALAQLRGQAFAATGAPARLATRAPDVAWDTVMLARALSRYDAYVAFIGGAQVAALAPRAQALVRSLAASQLETGMSRDVERAARPASFTGGSTLAFGAEREARARVAALAPAAGMLARVAGAYQQAGLGDAYDDLAAFLAAEADAALSAATGVLDARGAYVARDGGFSWWRGETPVSWPAFEVHDTAGLDAYLDTQRTDVTAAYTTYAEPVLSLLYADALAPYLSMHPEAAGPAAEWKVLGDQLAAYQAKKPSSLGALETFVASGMSTVAPGNCAPAAGGMAGTDWFAARGRALKTALYARCRQLSAAWASEGYEHIRGAFSASLAGRFPFSPADARQEADPNAVAAFLTAYGALSAVRGSIESGRDGVGGPGSAAAVFLARMDRVAAFLAPLVAADTGGGAAYRVTAAFRANRGREAGADQVAGWSMDVGSDRLTPRDSAGAAAGWSPGEAVSLAFRWAADSPVRPGAAGLPAGAGVDGATLTYAYGGSWALLRLLRERAAPARLLSAPPERVAHTLAFTTATVAAPLPVRGALGGAAPGDALLFVRVGVLDPSTGHALVLPAFPTSAPSLGAGGVP